MAYRKPKAANDQWTKDYRRTQVSRVYYPRKKAAFNSRDRKLIVKAKGT